MKITIESTSKIVLLKTSALADGVEARVWEGATESGIPVYCLVTRVAVAESGDAPEKFKEFEAELIEHRAPSAEVQAWPLRMII